MLNEISCWSVNWNAIGAVGAWVSGIGTLLAVWFAICQSQKANNEKKEFAKYLLVRDIQRVKEIKCSLLKMAEHLGGFNNENKAFSDSARTAFDRVLIKFKEDFDSLEYLSSSNQQFFYSPDLDTVSLASAVNGLSRVPVAVKDLLEERGSIDAAKYLLERGRKLSELLARGSIRKVDLATE